MLVVVLVILVVSAALVAGALWGVFGALGEKLEGFLVALAGGALLVSATSELVEPALEATSLLIVIASTLAGALVFFVADKLVDQTLGAQSGGGLLAAITLDGIPENLALGVALIGAEPMQVAALAGAILLSNLPEAAGGARDMCKNRMSKAVVVATWSVTALILSAAAIIGNVALTGVGQTPLAAIRCFAAGAVIASLATEVFPKAYKEERELSGIATAIGFVIAIALGQLGQGA
ncbi:MAG: hypothetical protein KF779_13175 [Hyphomonadaceae bacterium]|nr:hypothetical protein [Hyphomonadaceae bacterium]